MARVYTPIDGSTLMTALARQITGQQNLTVVDANSFMSIGETVLSYGIENVYNALGIVIGRTLVATRPYTAKIKLIQALNSGLFTSRMRKISYYSKDPIASGFFNTDLFTNLADGFTNGQNPTGEGNAQSVKSMWEQKQAMPLEMNFGGSTVWDYGITMYEGQESAPFRNAEELSRFVSGILAEHANDIESGKEAYNRLALVGHIGAASKNAYQAMNLTTMFNAKFGTSYTSEELRTTYLKEFLAFMVVTINQVSRRMTERSTHYHNPMTKIVNGIAYSILRHTPYDRQRLMLYTPLFEDAKAMVLPEIFHDGILDMDGQYEGVDYWQSNYSDDVRPAISIKTPIMNENGAQVADDTAVNLEYVVGMMYDRDALMVDYQLDRALTTPVEARKGYRNTWLHIAKNVVSDPTENTVVFYMQDED